VKCADIEIVLTTNCMVIYKITNTINNKVYIGQTIEPINKRWSAHCSKNSTCTFLKNAIQKYGKDTFIIEIIDGANNLTELNYLEQHYIHVYNSLAPNGYNLRNGGNNELHSEESKIKMRKPKSETAKLNMSKCRLGKKPSKKAIENSVKARMGKKLTEDHKLKCGDALKGRKFTDEHRKRISKSKKGKSPSMETREKIRQTLIKRNREINGIN